MDPSVGISLVTISTILVVSVWIVLEKRHPTSTLAWILVLVALPYLGLMLYLLLGRRRLKRRTAHKALKTHLVRGGLPNLPDTAHEGGSDNHALVKLFGAQEQLITLAMRNADAPVTVGNSVRILCNAEETYHSLFEAIREAQRYVLVQYYIVQPDGVGNRLRDLLAEKARAGLRVRVLCDGVGSWKLNRAWVQPLLDAGAEFAFFLPLRVPLFPSRLRWNFRNHRKVVVIDGHTGFTGGLNVGEEYEGKDVRLGYWRDTHLRVQGPAAGSLERIFAEDWYFATSKLLVANPHFPEPRRMGVEPVQVIPSGPDREWQSIHLQMFLAITTARRRVYITTPYFVPDEAIRVALIAAALRGVDVRLLVPHRSDLRLVLWAGRSYYGELLRAGVKIYEYMRGFLHAKALVVDGNCGTIGTANMDIRSFRLNFEVNAWLYSQRVAARLEEIFEKDMEDAREMTSEDYEHRPGTARVAEAFARLLSPLL